MISPPTPKPGFAWLLKMAWRDSRYSRGKLLLFVASIIVGIAALVAINSFGQNLRKDIDTQAGELLGADLILETRVTPDSLRLAFLDSLGGKRAFETSFASMAFFPQSGNSRLVEVRALEGPFPFYGTIETEPLAANTTFRDELGALVDYNLMIQYEVGVGDSIRIGKLVLPIEGKLIQAPGRSGIASTVAPVVYIPRELVAQTGLIRRGSRIEYKYYYQFESGEDVPALKEALLPQFRNLNFRAETIADRKESLGEAFANLTRFLNLVAFIALLLGCLGVASAVHIYIKDKLSSVAILRCMGVTGRQSFYIFLIQVACMGLIGSVIGVVLGNGIQKILPLILQEFLPFTASTDLSLPAMGQGLVTGIGISVLFALIPMLGIRKVSPLLTLRASYEAPTGSWDPLRILVGAMILLFIIGFAWLQTQNWQEALTFTAALLLGFLVLAGAARLSMWLVRKYFPVSWNFLWRQGLANLFRPNNQTLILVLSIGLGTAMISTLFFVQDLLLEQVSLSGSERNPNIMLFDIQSDQKDALAQLTRDYQLPVMQDIPIVTMRVQKLKDLTRTQALKDTVLDIPNWVFNSELRVSYRDSLVEGEEIIEGEWIPEVNYPGDTVYICLEQGFANRIKVKLGDPIIFNVQGALIPTRVGSIRTMKFDRMNFLILFPKGVLEQAPKFHLMTTRADSVQQSAVFQRAVVKEFPTVSIIDLGLILNTIDSIFQKISFVIRFMSLFSIITGLLVLAGSVIISKYQRIQESVLLRTLGAQRRQILWINALEYIFLGALASMTGILLSLLFSYGLAKFSFQTAFAPRMLPTLGLLLIVISATTLIGLLNIQGILKHPPLAILRKEN
ncbi:MAG: FtsX-like permease family protein [Bacteroidota bacterium]